MTHASSLMALALAGLGAAAAHAHPAPDTARPPFAGGATAPHLLVPQLAHWRCWQSFGDRRGFDECDSTAVVFLDGLPDGARRVSMLCMHELHYIATRQVAGNATSLGAREKVAMTLDTVDVSGSQAYVSVQANLVLPGTEATPMHYWDGPVTCTILGIR